ncbi:hypothetical protein LCGC14_2728090, partial [marine sediment metagenome]
MKPYYQDEWVTIYHGDCREILPELPEVDLVVTSPPYNLGKSYEQKVSLDEYASEQRKTIEACCDILSSTGSICWQVGTYIVGKGKAKEAFPLDIILYPIFKSLGLILRNRIVWHFGHGLHETVRFSGRHETILWFTPNSYVFNLDPVRVPQKYPGKKAYKGPNEGE